MSHRLIAACLAAALACGHEPAPSPAPPAPPDTGTPPPSNPPPSNPPPGNSPPAPPPGNPPPSNPQPGNPPPATPPPGDSSVTIRRLDDTAECDGLLPASAPAAVGVHVDEQDGGCGPGVSEGGGHVAIVRHFHQAGVDYQAFSPDGKPENRFETAPSLSCPADACETVVPQSDGFQAAILRGGNTTQDPTLVEVRTFAADGSLRHVEAATTSQMGLATSWDLSADPSGGSLLVAMAVTATQPSVAPDGKPCNAHAFRFGADGARRGAADLNCHILAGGVSTAGETLVLEGAEALHGTFPSDTVVLWRKPDGTSAAPPAADSSQVAALSTLAPLLDGGLALNEAGAWTRVFAHLGAASAPAPDWLASRDGWRMRFTRGNRGYALLPPPAQRLADCDPAVEIRAPSGRLCGTITFREEGGACTTAALDQGWDGTVVQQSGRDRCSYRWWPRLLAGE